MFSYRFWLNSYMSCTCFSKSLNRKIHGQRNPRIPQDVRRRETPPPPKSGNFLAAHNLAALGLDAFQPSLRLVEDELNPAVLRSRYRTIPPKHSNGRPEALGSHEYLVPSTTEERRLSRIPSSLSQNLADQGIC